MRNFGLCCVLLSGCFTDDLGSLPESPEPGPATETNTSRLVPDVCARHAYTGVLPSANDVDLAVAATHDGAAVLAVARGGGPVHGFMLDRRAELVGGGHVVRDGAYTSVSASSIDGRLFTASVAGKRVALDVVADDLGAAEEIATLDGALVGEVPLDAAPAQATGGRIAATGGAGGIRTTTFDASWAAVSSRVITVTPPTAMASAPMPSGDLWLAWSTDTTCGVQGLTGTVSSLRHHPCHGVRLAPSSTGGTLVFEDDAGNVQRATATGAGLGDPLPLGKFAIAPRVVFDGARTWASYLDVHGDVVVGYIDENGTLVSRALEGTRPLPDAYELVHFTDAVWVFSAHELGVSAQRICLVPQ